MPKQLYNEGRVVGYSSYETYVKHALSENPNEEPATEREWLASQLNHGLSLIVKIDPNTQTNPYHLDIPLPENSKLAAASTIVASLFFGDCEVDEFGWAKKITRYGQGISNTFDAHPFDSNPEHYPTEEVREFEESEKRQFLQYIKIQDGVILQPGSWIDNINKGPEKEFIPDLNKKPLLRIVFASKVVEPFYILLTGFTHRSIISGISDIDTGSASEVKYENGAYLGPEIYPWSNKVVFAYPGIATYYLRKGLVSTYDNLKIDHDEDSSETRFTVSYLRPGTGVSIYGPNEPGGDIKIGAKIGKDENKYIKVEQKLNTDENTGDDEIVTVLTHSRVLRGDGVFVTQPQKPAEDIYISSKIHSNNNYLKVEYVEPKSKDDNSIILTASPLNSNDSGGITITPPSQPGGSTNLTVNIESTNTNYLKVVKKDKKIYLTPITFSTDGNLIIKTDGTTIKFEVDVKKLITNIFQDSSNPLTKAITNILKKFAGSHTLNDDGTISWGKVGSKSAASEYVPLGTMNLLSGSDKQGYIRTHKGNETHDYWVK